MARKVKKTTYGLEATHAVVPLASLAMYNPDSDRGPQFIKPGSDIRAYRRRARRRWWKDAQGPSQKRRA